MKPKNEEAEKAEKKEKEKVKRRQRNTKNGSVNQKKKKPQAVLSERLFKYSGTYL